MKTSFLFSRFSGLNNSYTLKKSFEFSISRFSTNLISKRDFLNSKTEELLIDFNSSSGTVNLTINRPPANALGSELVTQMNETISELHNSPVGLIRSVILSSSNKKIFCAGADLKERKKMEPAQVSLFVSLLRSMMESLSNLPIPTIACVEGMALGGGMELALACDLRFASPNSTWALPETGLAIIPGAGGTQRLPRLVGRSIALDLIYSGKRLSGEESLKMGLANYIYDNPIEKAKEYADKLGSTKGPIAIRMAKEAISKGSQVDLENGLAFEKACYAQVIPTSDRLEGLKAFAEKRSPEYKGE